MTSFLRLSLLLVAFLAAFSLAAPAADLSLLKQGEAHVRAGEFETALALYQNKLAELADETPDEYIAQIARLLYQMEQTEDGLQFVNTHQDRRIADLYYYQGRMLLDLHRRDEALAAFEKALELNADHLGALFGKGMHLKREFQPPAEDQERAYEEEETDEIAIEELERKEKEIKDIFKKVKKLKPVSADDFEQKVNAFMMDQDIDAAESWINRAINRNPFRAPLLLSRCVIGATKGEFDVARPDCEKAKSLTKNADLLNAIDNLLQFFENGGYPEQQEESFNDENAYADL